MARKIRTLAAASSLLGALLVAAPSFAQKSGGVLKIFHWDSPASMSIHEEATYSTVVPMMGVFNNLVVYDQHVPQNSMQSIVPDLAAELVVERGGDRTVLQAAPRRQMARRQTIHRR